MVFSLRLAVNSRGFQEEDSKQRALNTYIISIVIVLETCFISKIRWLAVVCYLLYFCSVVLRCRQLAREGFARLRSDVLVKLELLDNKHGGFYFSEV